MTTWRIALARSFGALLLMAVLLCAGDYASLRYRGSGGRDILGSVTVRPVYVIHEKNGRVEYQFAQPQDETCVHSLFPHFGYSACWYVRRHTEKRIDI